MKELNILLKHQYMCKCGLFLEGSSGRALLKNYTTKVLLRQNKSAVKTVGGGGVRPSQNSK